MPKEKKKDVMYTTGNGGELHKLQYIDSMGYKAPVKKRIQVFYM